MNDYEQLVQQVNACTLCSLSQKRTRAVPGDGSLSADIMFIGEGPGFYEDQQGIPFVGRAGNLLNELLSSIGLKREDVYITNMVKCRPPDNRDPLPGEIEACSGYLDKQLELISPKVVVTLGRYSFGKFFPGESISRARGTPRRWRSMMIYPMYHPAAGLRNPKFMVDLRNDFMNLPKLIESMGQEQPEEAKEQEAPAWQLNLFEE